MAAFGQLPTPAPVRLRGMPDATGLAHSIRTSNTASHLRFGRLPPGTLGLAGLSGRSQLGFPLPASGFRLRQGFAGTGRPVRPFDRSTGSRQASSRQASSRQEDIALRQAQDCAGQVAEATGDRVGGRCVPIHRSSGPKGAHQKGKYSVIGKIIVL